MAARRRGKLDWGSVADLCVRALNRIGAFQPDAIESITFENGGEGIKEEEPGTIIANSEGTGFQIVYLWHDRDDNVATVRCRVQLDRIRRPYGWETVFRCPDCGRKCQRLALRSFGLVCASCGPVVSWCSRKGKVARLVWRANLLSYQLGCNSWSALPLEKPKHMAAKRYVALLEQRAKVVRKIGAELAKRRRFYGEMPMIATDYCGATRPLPENFWNRDWRGDE
jgi:hypothetical protein